MMSAIVRKTKRSGYKRNISRLRKTERIVGKGVISHYTRSCDSYTRGEVGNRQGGENGEKDQGWREAGREAKSGWVTSEPPLLGDWEWEQLEVREQGRANRVGEGD